MHSRKHLRIYFAEKPLREHHLSVLEATKSRSSNIALRAGWANKSFAVDLSQILGNLVDEYVLGRLQLNEQPVGPEGLKRGVEDSQAFLDLCIACASQRAWTMSVHRMCQPDSWMGVLDEQLEFRRECFENLQKDVKLIREAWKVLETKDPNADLEVWVCFFIPPCVSRNLWGCSISILVPSICHLQCVLLLIGTTWLPKNPNLISSNLLPVSMPLAPAGTAEAVQ